MAVTIREVLRIVRENPGVTTRQVYCLMFGLDFDTPLGSTERNLEYRSICTLLTRLLRQGFVTRTPVIDESTDRVSSSYTVIE